MLEANAGQPRFDIDKVVISGFKCIHEPLAIDILKPLNILVGDNGVGKSTILEAIHLALTGMYRGEPIRRALSQTLFNNADVACFVAGSSDGHGLKLPRICIEVFLNGGGREEELLSGAVNSERQKCCGFTFTVEFDEDYREELEALPDGCLNSVPIEYYDFKWTTFADAPITPRKIPVRSVMINPAGDWQGNRADERATRTFIDGLGERQQMALAQDARIAIDAWNAKDSLSKANAALPSIGIEGMGSVDIVADRGTSESWKRNIVVRLEEIPYGHIGAGSQSMMQAGIALGKSRPEKTTLLLFEEPENHLSHVNLNKLVKLLSDGAIDRKIIVTTHSSYVANVLGLENLQMIGNEIGHAACAPITSLPKDTFDFFRKLPGYDTLRLVLARCAVLVEGPSDELIVQLAYRKKHAGRLPIEDGIDVISVGSGFLRFLELASAIRKRVLVLTDNDGNPESLKAKYCDYSGLEFVKISYVEEIRPANDPNNVDPERKINWNTLEAEMLEANGFGNMKKLLGREDDCEARLLKHMEGNKTDTALTLFDADSAVVIPKYIDDGLGWLDEQQ
ncbi:ATP-dependent endonuclease [Olsenella sp. DNF00959]|uniref:ATP-dependent nuclease n=1 Tax=Olsenella sp. DNF00959 TaxID=1476999 RepID=UPI000780A699|nr:AAA family ATPase [Olsenella sp. DNF00959]KXB63516.1 hypothetical protein HMPREF1868_00600 [Olsenella sp. DNF00959]